MVDYKEAIKTKGSKRWRWNRPLENDTDVITRWWIVIEYLFKRWRPIYIFKYFCRYHIFLCHSNLIYQTTLRTGFVLPRTQIHQRCTICLPFPDLETWDHLSFKLGLFCSSLVFYAVFSPLSLSLFGLCL